MTLRLIFLVRLTAAAFDLGFDLGFAFDPADLAFDLAFDLDWMIDLGLMSLTNLMNLMTVLDPHFRHRSSWIH